MNLKNVRFLRNNFIFSKITPPIKREIFNLYSSAFNISYLLHFVKKFHLKGGRPLPGLGDWTSACFLFLSFIGC